MFKLLQSQLEPVTPQPKHACAQTRTHREKRTRKRARERERGEEEGREGGREGRREGKRDGGKEGRREGGRAHACKFVRGTAAVSQNVADNQA